MACFTVKPKQSMAYTFLLNTDELKMALRARKGSRAFVKRAPGHLTIISHYLGKS